MKNSTIIMISVLILLISLSILIVNYEKKRVAAGFLDRIEINQTDLKECCIYYVNNEKKTCKVFNDRSCDLCNRICFKQ